ncbi:MAG: peptide deformylase [Kiritimatiellae bacterium]|nr:peptide deformylase [Kiritimatiellia bacterium]
MNYRICTYGDPILRTPSAPVASVDNGLRQLAQDMVETMHAANGVGLAAQQIGRTEAVCVVDLPAKMDTDESSGQRQNPGVPMPLVLVNPEITARSGREVRDEGCLSFPELFASIARATDVTVRFTDLKGKEQSLYAKGFLARAIQHELDHLNGVLIVDRMSAVTKIGMAGRLKRLKKQTKARLAAAAEAGA